jgi:hypothetical protein
MLPPYFFDLFLILFSGAIPMARMTKISIPVTFEKTVKVSYVNSSKLQKDKKDAQATTKTLGVMKPSVSIGVPELHWQEESDPIAKTVTLAVKEVRSFVTFTGKIWIDNAIDKKCECFKHVFDHEKRHAKIWNKGVKGYGNKIRAEVSDAVNPKLFDPKTVKESEVRKVREEAFKAIDKALEKAVLKYGKKVQTESRKIHTSGELRKTNDLCRDYLM